MRILLDTNIFIPLEDSSVDLNALIARFNRLASGKHDLLIHPATILDISRDKNSDRKRKILARIPKYNELESPPKLDFEEEIELFGQPKKENDRVDNLILYALHSNCVHWLITEDLGIHKKAKTIGQEERVLTIEQAISSLQNQNSEERNLFPNIENIPCHSINLNNNFFDSLREGYSLFDTWFINQCSKTGRHAWVWQEENDIHAICIYKKEQDPLITTDKKGLPGKVLKLCTFKVAKNGNKIGELLLKQAFNHAIKNNYEYIYITVEPNKFHTLEMLLKDYGFYQYGIEQDGRDLVYVKEFPLKPPTTNDKPLEYAIRYYPYIKCKGNNFYLVPIRPIYHRILFPELERQPDLFSSSTSAGNAIKQAYLCKAPVKIINPGDILFFYRTHDDKAITTYGVVDQFHIENDPEKILQWVSKRTVFSYDEIQDMANSDVKVILFRFIRHLSDNLNYDTLIKRGIVNGPIQSITKLDNEKVGLLLQEAGIEDSTLFN